MPHHHKSPEQKITILQKITNFLIGFFGGIMLFMLCLGILPSMWGAFLGTAVNAALSWYLLKIFRADKSKRIAIYGIITSIIAVIAIYLLLAALVVSMFSTLAG